MQSDVWKTFRDCHRNRGSKTSQICRKLGRKLCFFSIFEIRKRISRTFQIFSHFFSYAYTSRRVLKMLILNADFVFAFMNSRWTGNIIKFGACVAFHAGDSATVSEKKAFVASFIPHIQSRNKILANLVKRGIVREQMRMRTHEFDPSS